MYNYELNWFSDEKKRQNNINCMATEMERLYSYGTDIVRSMQMRLEIGTTSNTTVTLSDRRTYDENYRILRRNTTIRSFRGLE